MKLCFIFIKEYHTQFASMKTIVFMSRNLCWQELAMKKSVVEFLSYTNKPFHSKYSIFVKQKLQPILMSQMKWNL